MNTPEEAKTREASSPSSGADRRDDQRALGKTKPDGFAAFLRAFSCTTDERLSTPFSNAVQPTFAASYIGVLRDHTIAEDTQKRLILRDDLAANLVRKLLADPDILDYEALRFFWSASYRFRESKNPIWAWFVFSIHLQCGLPAPDWVWEYMADVAFKITDAAAIPRPLLADTPIDIQNRNEAVIDALGLARHAGVRDHLDQFRREVSEYRRALMVANLAHPGNLEKIPIMTACEQVASEERKAHSQAKPTTGEEKETQTKHIYDIYRRWFPEQKRSVQDDKSPF